MRENRLKSMWQRGETALNGWLQIPSAWSAELMAHQGWDSLTIDLQHGLIGYETALLQLQAISTTEVVPLARVPWNEPGIIMKLLDAGAYGIICPMINNRAEAEAFVDACRYAPEGYRSVGPTRARVYGGGDYQTQANKTIITMAMIETAEALENVEAIVSVSGLDAIYIGPADLSLSLTGAVQVDYTEPDLLAVLDTILAVAQKHDVVAGIHTSSPEFAQKMIDTGFQLVTVSSDSGLLRDAAEATVVKLKGTVKGQGEASPY
ncbi:MAG: 2,4-dihydroxyhept-2-ene-1,7-dioic acid aldolase [Anaerolineaceae bacterium]|nr:2,4-dihydroxyhept-2-ene-1,7-dioic acid aldolase [Anaerolineaceae bacterium]MCB9101334.1 2,4-dihydroxyhept-2-ene-1,7-dioic acid aldolase [Anaerolineales bacterium]